LNDNLIDFWMQLITRMEFQPDSSIHVCTTHFYTKLEDEGVNSILRWAATKGIDVPIHRNQHWSLMVIIYAGLTDFYDELNNESEIPCLVHLDGLGLLDRKEMAANLRCWLNAEYDRKKMLIGIFHCTNYEFIISAR
jgi:Ulp1 family protease